MENQSHKGAPYDPGVLAQVFENLIENQLAPAPTRLCIAYSGGLDTRVLLHSIHRIKDLQSSLNVNILAFHVNHGLSSLADLWERECQRTCTESGFAFEAIRVQIPSGPGLSVEEQARVARYAALRARVQKGDWWITAHHQDDQVETLLLQLLRGAGVRGLSAMPLVQAFGEASLIRPLLQMPRSALYAYAQQQGLLWINDPSNEDQRYARNYVRHSVVPVIAARWPSYGTTLQRSAALAADAAALAEDLAEIDFEQCSTSDVGQLHVPSLVALPPHRLRNLLAYWPRRLGLPTPYRTHIDHIIAQMLHAANDACPLVTWPGVEVRRYTQHLYMQRPLAPAPPADWQVVWDGLSMLETSTTSVLLVRHALGMGVSLARLQQGALTVRVRRGGEVMQLLNRRGHHPLKHLFQEARIPPWLRQRLPLVFQGETLVFVPGIGVAEGCAAKAGEPGVTWEWSSLNARGGLPEK